ncbi:MAG: hypothetical protein HC794_04085 [Nitrospiraceae bacterium]|nr:hypothetical protein [Nitrospiraceae bacterium]
MHRNNAGHLIRDEWYGGDVTQIPLGNTCSFTAENLGMAPFAQRHQYTAGVRSTSEWMENDTAYFNWKVLDRSIEPRTGLVLSERDLSQIQTDYEYDAMFRRTWSKPESTHGGWTEIVYTPGSPLNLPIVEEPVVRAPEPQAV